MLRAVPRQRGCLFLGTTSEEEKRLSCHSDVGGIPLGNHGCTAHKKSDPRQPGRFFLWMTSEEEKHSPVVGAVLQYQCQSGRTAHRAGVRAPPCQNQAKTRHF